MRGLDASAGMVISSHLGGVRRSGGWSRRWPGESESRRLASSVGAAAEADATPETAAERLGGVLAQSCAPFGLQAEAGDLAIELGSAVLVESCGGRGCGIHCLVSCSMAGVASDRYDSAR
jgi:hypothetical protein